MKIKKLGKSVIINSAISVGFSKLLTCWNISGKNIINNSHGFGHLSGVIIFLVLPFVFTLIFFLRKVQNIKNSPKVMFNTEEKQETTCENSTTSDTSFKLSNKSLKIKNFSIHYNFSENALQDTREISSVNNCIIIPIY